MVAVILNFQNTNNQNTDDNKCLKWCFARYLNLADHNAAIIRKQDKDLARKLDFKDIRFPANVRDIHITEKKIVSVLEFLVMRIKKNSQSTFQKIFLRGMLTYY